MSPLALILIFVVATAAGYKVIRDVPSLLHTPLMSGMNALSGVTILGSLVATALAAATHNKALGFIAIMMWCIMEPIFYLNGPPFGVKPGSPLAFEWAHLYGMEWRFVRL